MKKISGFVLLGFLLLSCGDNVTSVEDNRALKRDYLEKEIQTAEQIRRRSQEKENISLRTIVYPGLSSLIKKTSQPKIYINSRVRYIHSLKEGKGETFYHPTLVYYLIKALEETLPKKGIIVFKREKADLEINAFLNFIPEKSVIYVLVLVSGKKEKEGAVGQFVVFLSEDFEQWIENKSQEFFKVVFDYFFSEDVILTKLSGRVFARRYFSVIRKYFRQEPLKINVQVSPLILKRFPWVKFDLQEGERLFEVKGVITKKAPLRLVLEEFDFKKKNWLRKEYSLKIKIYRYRKAIAEIKVRSSTFRWYNILVDICRYLKNN